MQSREDSEVVGQLQGITRSDPLGNGRATPSGRK
jgi:hypothetical protein